MSNLIRTLSQENLQEPQQIEQRESSPEIALPGQNRVSEVHTDRTEPDSLIARDVKPMLTAAELDQLYQEGLSLFNANKTYDAIGPLKIAADQDDLRALKLLIRAYKTIHSFRQSFYYTEKLASQGDTDAKAIMADSYENGFPPVQQDKEKAAALYRELGDIYEKRGESATEDRATYSVQSFESAISHYRHALNLGCQEAKLKVGFCYAQVAEKYEINQHHFPFVNQLRALKHYHLAVTFGYKSVEEKVFELGTQIMALYEPKTCLENLKTLTQEPYYFIELRDLYLLGALHPNLLKEERLDIFFEMCHQDREILGKNATHCADIAMKQGEFYAKRTQVADKLKAEHYFELAYPLNRDSIPLKIMMERIYAQVAEMYQNGTGGAEVNIEKAYQYYEKAIASGYQLPIAKTLEIYRYFLQKGNDLAMYPSRVMKLQALYYYSRVIKYKKENPELPIEDPPIGKLYFDVARMFKNGKDGDKSLSKAYEYYLMAIKRGYDVPDSKIAKLEFEIGRQYESGTNVAMDKSLALEWYERALQRGHAYARFRYGLMYIKGDGTPPNEIIGYMHLKTAAQMGQIDAIGWMINKAERRNDPMAQMTLGLVYRDGVSGQVDLGKAIHYYEMAELQALPEASLALGEIYLYMKNFSKALHHFKVGSDRRNMNCHQKLATLYYNGTSEVQVNIPLALEYYERLALANDAEGQHMAGLICYRGEGGSGLFYQRAVQHFQNAANQNYKESEYMLGVMYLENKGIDAYLSAEERATRALSLLNRSSEQHFAPASYRLGKMYHRSHPGGPIRDLNEASKFYERAREQGYEADKIDQKMHLFANESSRSRGAGARRV